VDPTEATRRQRLALGDESASDSRRSRRGRLLVSLRIAEASVTEPIRAVTYLGPSGFRTFSAPHRFIGADGRIYLVKQRAQQGLGAEAFANALAEQLQVGPEAAVVEIGPGVLPTDGRLSYMVGQRVATVELDDVLNHQQLLKLGYTPDPAKVDWPSWVRTIAFHTWIYAGDPQAVLRVTDGRIFSIDHGDCFRELLRGGPTGLIVPALYGVAGVSFDQSYLSGAIDTVEDVSESDLVRMAARIPDGPGWRMPIERKIRLIEWLLDRQPGVREVIGWRRLS
jgi:hypothetical protein